MPSEKQGSHHLMHRNISPHVRERATNTGIPDMVIIYLMYLTPNRATQRKVSNVTIRIKCFTDFKLVGADFHMLVNSIPKDLHNLNFQEVVNT